MATKLSAVDAWRASRRQSDITRLATQYKSQMDALSSQYQTEFDAYQKRVGEMTSGYEAKVSDYTAKLDAYEANVRKPYQTALASYLEKLKAFNANPYTSFTISTSYGYRRRSDGGGLEYGNFIGGLTPQEYANQLGLVSATATQHGYTRNYTISGMKAFTESAPAKPAQFTEELPTAPQIEAFDNTNFEQGSAAAGLTYQREVSERKSARLNAVRRGASGGLLANVKA